MKRFVFFTMVLLFIGCANGANKGKKEVASRSVTTLFRSTDSKSCLKDGIYTIDVNKKYPKKSFKLEELADIKYIPLETTDSVLWSGYEICSIHENLIIGADARSGDVKFHDAEGHFLFSFNHRGKGKGKYDIMRSFYYDQKRDEVFIRDRYKSEIFVYNSQGEFKRSFLCKYDVMRDETFDAVHELRELNASEFIGYTYKHNFLVFSKKDGRRIKKIDVSHKKDLTLFFYEEKDGLVYTFKTSVSMFAREKDGYMLTSFCSDTIFRITDSTRDIQPVIVRTPPIFDMEVPVFLFTDLCTSDYYFMNTVKKEYDKKTNTGFESVDLVVDRKSGKVYEYTLIHPDCPKSSNITNISAQRHSLSSGTFARLLNAFHLRKAYKENKLSGELKNIASKLKDDDNPVLMIVKFK